MAHTSYLTAPQKQSLLAWIGARGEGYDAYLDWCQREDIDADRRFTRLSYQSWVQRRRPLVQRARSGHQEEMRRVSRMDREARMAALEESFMRLNVISRGTDDGDKLARLEEQKRKILEAIAKERGEWGKAPAASDEQPMANEFFARLRQREAERGSHAASA